MNYGRTSLGLRRFAGTAPPRDCGSIHVLEKLRLGLARTFLLKGQEGRPVCMPLRDTVISLAWREFFAQGVRTYSQK